MFVCLLKFWLGIPPGKAGVISQLNSTDIYRIAEGKQFCWVFFFLVLLVNKQKQKQNPLEECDPEIGDSMSVLSVFYQMNPQTK